MSLALRNNGNGNGNGNGSVSRYRDPLALARELMSWDPFFAGRPASAFVPAFEVKETVDNFIVKLRKKIEKDDSHPQWITTVRGVGYRFEPFGNGDR